MAFAATAKRDGSGQTAIALYTLSFAHDLFGKPLRSPRSSEGQAFFRITNHGAQKNAASGEEAASFVADT
jgi:hypothetical protein